jgi:malonyl-CoA decarboxylase
LPQGTKSILLKGLLFLSRIQTEIRRITYNTTSAGIIEKIAIKEAVHPMKSLDDLRKRLGPERRVFALFHPLMPDEPLVILHVHLETKPNHVPSSMPHVLTEEPSNMPLKPLVATFYSISNTQHGLTRGLGLGEFLIKQAVQQLQQEFPSSLQTFVTLSPMPAFRKWLEGIVSSTTMGSDHEWAKALAAEGVIPTSLIQQYTLARPILQELIESGKTNDDGDVNIQDKLEKTRDILMQLAAHYLVTMKNRRSGKPLDPVTGFHVGNGAEIFRINFAADLSRKGLLRSFGVMVNYRYQLENIETNKAKFESSHYQMIPVSALVQDLVPFGAD